MTKQMTIYINPSEIVGDFFPLVDEDNKKTYKEITAIKYIKNSNCVALELDNEKDLYLITYAQLADLNNYNKKQGVS